MSDSEFDIEVSTDASTSFETQRTSRVNTHTYSQETERREPGIGTDPGDSSDEVEPRRLMADPHLNDIRWLYRTFWAQTLVDKPVEDAFKNGYEVDHDGEKNINNILSQHNWENHYKYTRIKARRDGFALSYFVLDDDSDGPYEDPLDDSVTVEGIKKVETITLDDLARFKTAHGAVPAGAEADPLEGKNFHDYEIRPTGIVMDTDPESETYKEPLGYLIGPPDWTEKADVIERIQFVHRNRILHYTENETVDGDLDDDTLGKYEGDSVLVSPYHLLRGLKKGNWSLMQTIFRYAAKMYHVELPDDADDDDWEEANDNMQNLNAKSELITPAGYEIEDFQTDGQLDPEEYFNVIFDQVCASSEMTKSVLFGTQTGTTTGSETDIKNYFNKVERERQREYETDMRRFVSHVVKLTDGRASENYDLQFDVEWGPLFKLSELDNAERLTRVMQTLSAGINDFVLTPGEARSILKEEWANADIDWERDFSEEEQQFLKTLNVAQVGTEAVLEKESFGPDGTSAEGGRNNGMEKGQTTSGPQPNSDGLTDRDVNKIAEQVVTIMEDQ